jgi:hypothetical protein
MMAKKKFFMACHGGQNMVRTRVHCHRVESPSHNKHSVKGAAATDAPIHFENRNHSSITFVNSISIMHISAASMGLVIHQTLTDTLKDAVRRLAAERNADYALLRDGLGVMLFLCQNNGRLSFNSGMETIRKKLLGGPITRINLPKNPLTYFHKQWPEGVPVDVFVEFNGDSFSPETIRRSYTRTERLLDANIPVSDLVDAGDIKASEARNISKARVILAQEDVDWETKSRPDLKGPCVLTFDRYINGRREGPSVDVTIVGRPSNFRIKQKHYWIYSSPAYDKSTTVGFDLVEKFSAAFIPDPENAVNVPTTAQLLILDEASSNRRIPIGQLRGLTGGFASTSYLNRRAYGQSFIPREDAQFIILSRHSPYEVYAEKKTGRMSYMNTLSIESRFNVIRLDGRNMDEKIRFADVKALTKYEFNEALYQVLYDANRKLNQHGMLRKVHIRNALARCYSLYMDRFSKDGNVILSTDTFLVYMQSLLHEGDLPVYEQVHRDYARCTGYRSNKMRVDETMVRVPVMQRPDTHVAPVEKIQDMGTPKDQAASPNVRETTLVQQPMPTPPTPREPGDKEMEAVYMIDPPKEEAAPPNVPEATPAQRPPPTPPTLWGTDEPDDEEMEAAYTMSMNAIC